MLSNMGCCNKFHLKMSSAIFFTLTLTLILGSSLVSGITECVPQDLCSCKFDDGTMMDITSLGNTDNTPRFKDVLAQEGNYYSYNPCKGFTEGACKDESVCITNPQKTQSLSIGDSSTAQFKYDTATKNVVAAYTSGSVGRLLLSEIILVCDTSATSPTATAQGQQDGGFFQMTVTTVCACPNGCTASGPTGGGGSGSGLSAGSILCIALFVVLVVYIGLGTVTMKFVKKKEGVEIVPNVLFWRSLPVLIKTVFIGRLLEMCQKPSKIIGGGAMFTLGLCIPKFRDQGYESK